MFETILGTIMLYSWIHGIIIISKKITGTTRYENIVVLVGLIGFILLLLGVLMG